MRRTTRFVSLLALAGLSFSVAAADHAPPTTQFEDSGGAQWTPDAAEWQFLDAVAESPRVSLTEIGRTRQNRPLHLVVMGEPAPRNVEDVLASGEPVVLFSCSFHGNEPAGREACLKWMRDLAFTDDPVLLDQMRHQTILFFPTANPDGRAANTRGNSRGTDINRDHLNLETEEAQALALITRTWQPDAAADLHEYGPGVPGVYDDDMLYLWPRNLNTDEGVRLMARTLAETYVGGGVESDGYRAGEYGLYGFGDDVVGADYHVTQTAGDGDEGIARNAWSLKHTASILLESAVSTSPYHLPGDGTTAGLQTRRVDTHMSAIRHVLRFMRDYGHTAASVQDAAAKAKTREGAERSAPVYFDGQDEDRTLDGSGADTSSVEAPCGYALTAEQVAEVGLAAALHGTEITVQPDGSGFVTMAQPTEPLIALLLDGRGNRNSISATPLDDCSAYGA